MGPPAEDSDLLQETMLRTFYSSEQIVTWAAKRDFVAPGFQPFPKL